MVVKLISKTSSCIRPILACTLSDVISMSDTLAALLFLLVPLRHSKADRRMAKDSLVLIQDMVVA